MPSGKRARQQRQQTAATAPPPVRSKGVGGRARQASPRALAIGGGVALVIVIAIVLAVVLGSGGSSGGSGSRHLGTWRACRRPEARTRRSPSRAHRTQTTSSRGYHRKGLSSATRRRPSRWRCSSTSSARSARTTRSYHLPGVVKKYIADGKVQLHLQPWAFLGPQSFTGRYGVIAAADQNKGFEYAKVLYDNQGTEESRLADRQGDGGDRRQRQRPQPRPVEGRRQQLGHEGDRKQRRQARDAEEGHRDADHPRRPHRRHAAGRQRRRRYNPTGVDQALAAAVANS